MPSSLVLLVFGVGLADSINPVPIAVAVAFASRSLGAVTEFAVSYFAVTLLAGLIVVLPGDAIHHLFASISIHTFRIAQVIGGVTGMTLGFVLLIAHERRRRSGSEPSRVTNRSPIAVGATLAALDLPTALPYFGVLTAIIGGASNIGARALLVVIFNLCYAGPVFAVAAARAIAGERAEKPLRQIGAVVDRWGPRVLGVAAVTIGSVMLVKGIRGL